MFRARAAVVAIHGILTSTTDKSWPDDLNEFLLDCKVERRDYFAGPLSVVNVFIRNGIHARALARELEPLSRSLPLHFVGHSNGTDIALKTIKILASRGVRVETAIFTGSVLDPDVEKSGILKLIESRMLGRAYAYCSGADLPLRIPWLLKWPYKDLGVCGWKREGQPYEEIRIRTRQYPKYGHGGYFSTENREHVFNQMRLDMAL